MFIKYGLITKDGEVFGMVNMDHVANVKYDNRYVRDTFVLILESYHGDGFCLEFPFDSEEKAKDAFQLFEWVMSGYGSKSIEGLGSTFKV